MKSIKDNKLLSETSFEDIRDGKHVYHYEYTNIHNQRIALVRIMHLWHQIGFPAAIAIFGFFFSYGLKRNDPLFLAVGAILGTLVVIFVRKYALALDQSVIRLYPRIIFLELVLDYHFYRNYLSTKKNDGKEGAEKKFVEQCESIIADNTKDLWEKINYEFKPEYFPAYKRGHGILNKAAWIIGISFWVLTLLTVIYLPQNSAGINKNAQQAIQPDRE